MTKIAFFTENGFEGYVPRNHNNARTEMAWMIATGAYHFNIHHPYNTTEKFDLGVVIIPKNNPQVDVDRIRSACDKVAIMQEGPHWFWQDYDVARQVEFFNTLVEADFILCHNEVDRKYYSGLTEKPTYILQSLMIEDTIVESEIKKDAVIIGGNFVSWYGGIDSYILASRFELPIHGPSMGRKKYGEEELIIHLPYMPWTDWMHELSSYRYAVHMMRTYAAGTFFMNTARFQIPTIGYNSTDAARILHPLTTVDEGDMEASSLLVEKLKDKKFYKLCSETAIKRYNQYYTESAWLQKWENILKSQGLL